MILMLLMGGAFLCGLQALRARELLACAGWLAAVSGLVALTFYQLSAPEAAAIELSVGAGLVTVLFVFAISLAGEESLQAKSLLPRPLSWGLVLLAAGLLAWLLLPATPPPPATAEAGPSFSQVMWQERGLDVPVQVILIFSGVLGVLGLLAEPAGHTRPDAPALARGMAEKGTPQ